MTCNPYVHYDQTHTIKQLLILILIPLYLEIKIVYIIQKHRYGWPRGINENEYTFPLSLITFSNSF